MLELKEVRIFDGGFGSEIEKRGLDANLCADYNLLAPEVVQEIHLSYAKADYITTNSFGLNRIRYRGSFALSDLAKAAVRNARVTGKQVLFDIGPTGQLMRPIGTLSFDEAYDVFREVVLLTRDDVDGYILETFSDLYEMKAAVLAVKENAPDKLLFATMTFDGTGRTLTGSTPEIVVNTLEGLGVDALGVNCGPGPEGLLDVVKRILSSAAVPVLVQPNRCIPEFQNGRAVYNLSAESFYAFMEQFVRMGVSLIGGCCGTDPEIIEAISRLKGTPIVKKTPARKTIVNSATMLTEIDGVVICGERLNPTGKKLLKRKLAEEDYDYLVQEALKQADHGARVLDLNVGVPKLNERVLMKNALVRIQEYADTPIQIDTSDFDAMEDACRYYNGIPLINSVNGKKEVMERVFPIAKRYGAVVLGLTMDEQGIPRTAEERLRIAERILREAETYGIPREKIMIDTLVLTASAEQELVQETLRALTLVRALGVKTALGVSNVSFGLPNRPLLNKTFLTMALYAGLNMPILNPLDEEMGAAIDAFRVLMNQDPRSEKYIARFDGREEVTAPAVKETMDLKTAVKNGLVSECEKLTALELENHDPMYVVNELLVSALKEVGTAYEKQEIYLPRLIAAAEAAKAAFQIVSAKFPKTDTSKGKVIMATVQGDVHDIGKNICKVVLESYGYDVIDLGKDTPIQAVVDAYERIRPLAIGLSALMTTTVISLENTIEALRAAGCTSAILVGGAVLTADIARAIGADYYSKDALEMVEVLEKLR
ncbi:MAG: homocysteine S-methyltransferase family protein [Lachnospiraceae bacterium]|nr:homocysteine S-methyltransferase family protein [Lachnospiraceae bacterium]